jgi:hypothetical protein
MGLPPAVFIFHQVGFDLLPGKGDFLSRAHRFEIRRAIGAAREAIRL